MLNFKSVAYKTIFLVLKQKFYLKGHIFNYLNLNIIVLFFIFNFYLANFI